MAKKILFLPLLLFSLLFISFDAQSDVLIEDSREASIGVNNQINVTSGDIETGDGETGNYVIIACANDNTDGLSFNAPNPLVWTQLDEGSCFSLSDPVICAHSIWGAFVDDPNSQTITCEWGPATVLYVAGSMRYTNVDPVDPLIAVECQSGQGSVAVAPSIETEAGSQVLRVATVGVSTQQPGLNNNIASRAEPVDTFAIAALSFEFSRTLGILGLSELFEFAGPTGTEDFTSLPLTQWRACTIGIRMLNTRNVPTMSEWGLIGFAAFAGIAGIWYLRRRKATA